MNVEPCPCCNTSTNLQLKSNNTHACRIIRHAFGCQKCDVWGWEGATPGAAVDTWNRFARNSAAKYAGLRVSNKGEMKNDET